MARYNFVKIKKRYIFTGIVILLGPALFIQSAKKVNNIVSTPIVKKEAPANPYLQEFISNYDSTIQTIVHKTPGAAIVIVKGDSIIFSKGYGIASQKTGDSIDINTVFRIGSVSKGFASTLTGVIAQDNKVNFDDLVIDYVGLPGTPKDIQVVDLELKVATQLVLFNGIPCCNSRSDTAVCQHARIHSPIAIATARDRPTFVAISAGMRAGGICCNLVA